MVIFILGFGGSGTSFTSYYFRQIGHVPPIDAHRVHQSGESYWVNGLVNGTEQLLKRKEKPEPSNDTMLKDIETEIQRFYHHNPNVSLIKKSSNGTVI